MGDSTKNIMEIYDDIDLCYKVMGLSFSDNPDRVDKVYKSLMDEYQQLLQSSDSAARKQAQENIDQTKDLYERITGSMIYKDYAREYEKYKALKDAQKQEKQQKAEAEKDLMVECPYCNKKISPKIKVCMYCHGKILSPTEMMFAKIFSKKNLIVAAVVLVLIAVGMILALNQQLIKSILN